MQLFDTYTRKKEELRPIEDKKIGIYSCGPTVYARAHIGNMRTYVFMDLLNRALRYNGYDIKHVMNITDVGHLLSDEDEGEDKMEVAARKEKKTPEQIAAHYTKLFFEDIAKLNINTPEITPKATEHIDDMIAFVKGLIEKGYGYETSDGIYFDISKFEDYGKLSRLDLENQRAGARVSVNEEKRHPSDFAIWKKAEPNHIMQWKSPWGMGYPGWHIECSAMSRKYLGDTFDIHTGGVDHIPIHHENEIAQTEALTGEKMARYWMHGEFLQVDGGKMSKSLGNTYSIETLEEKGFRALDFRYFCLNANYSKKLNFTWEGLKAANTAYTRLLEGVSEHKDGNAHIDPDILKEHNSRFDAAVADDLNIPLALSVTWSLVKLEQKSKDIYKVLLDMDRILGLSFDKADVILEEDMKTDIPKEVLELADKRAEAKKNREYAKADEIREEIKSKGYEVRDTREGPVIVPVDKLDI